MSAERIILDVAGSPEESAALVEKALRRGFTRFVLAGPPPADASHGETWIRDGARLVSFSDNPQHAVELRRVATPAELEVVRQELSHGASIALSWDGERILPLETLVAHRGEGARLWVLAASPKEVPAYLGALEHGADAVVVGYRRPGDLDVLEKLLESPVRLPTPQFVPVRRVEPGGLGDRILVDTTSILSPTEGLWVGSAAALLVHVTSEAVGSRYTRPRPFRVNAGAVHSYTLLSSGETRYLTELRAGDSALVSDPMGHSRPVRVGRIKIERRPLSLVEVEREGRRFTVFLQEAETVRLSGDHGPIAVTDVKEGDRVAVVPLPPGRHLGQPVEETVEER